MEADIVRYEDLHPADRLEKTVEDEAKLLPFLLHLFGRDPMQARSLFGDRRRATDEMRLLREAGSHSVEHLPREEDQGRRLYIFSHFLLVEYVQGLRIKDEVMRGSFWRSLTVEERGTIDIDLHEDRGTPSSWRSIAMSRAEQVRTALKSPPQQELHQHQS